MKPLYKIIFRLSVREESKFEKMQKLVLQVSNIYDLDRKNRQFPLTRDFKTKNPRVVKQRITPKKGDMNDELQHLAVLLLGPNNLL